MRSSTLIKASAIMFALVLGIIFAPHTNAQRAGASNLAIQFNTNAFGGQLGHEQVNGSFGNIFGGGKWISLGQPGGFGGPLPVYGMRIQDFGTVSTYSINDLPSGDKGLELQWGGDMKQFNINYIFDPFNQNGNAIAMSFFANDVIGVRTESPVRTFTVHHQSSSSSGGLTLRNENTNNRWGFYTNGSFFSPSLELYRNGAFRGRFDANSGIYFPVSDSRLKKDVQNLDNVMDDIMKLRPTTYLFNDQKDDTRNYGLIAQELKEVFPDMVNVRELEGEDDVNLPDLHTVGYTNLIPVLIKGMQEQQAEIEELKAQLATTSEKGATDFINETRADVLFQNSPNPFSSFTNIEYQLTPGFKTAAIYVFDLNGRQVLSYNNLAAGEGSVTIPGNELDPGMFLYSLVVDGQEVSTKRMILTK